MHIFKVGQRVEVVGTNDKGVIDQLDSVGGIPYYHVKCDSGGHVYTSEFGLTAISVPKFQVGDRVNHGQFGSGEVLSGPTKAINGHMLYDVRFDLHPIVQAVYEQDLSLINSAGIYPVPSSVLRAFGIDPESRIRIKTGPECECGAHKVKDAGHATWCELSPYYQDNRGARRQA